MKEDQYTKNRKIFSVKQTSILTLIFGVLLVAGAVYAWNPVWHEPASWVSDGYTIEAQELGESLQYLYDISSGGLSISCTTGQIAQYDGSTWVCADIPACVTPPTLYVRTVTRRSGDDGGSVRYTRYNPPTLYEKVGNTYIVYQP